MPDTITRDHSLNGAIGADPVLVLYQQWLDANRTVEAVVEAGRGLYLGPKCEAQEKRLARALSRRNKIQDQIEQTAASTPAGLCARIEIAAFVAEEMCGTNPEHRMILAARDDARRLFGALPAPKFPHPARLDFLENPSPILQLVRLWKEADRAYDAVEGTTPDLIDKTDVDAVHSRLATERCTDELYRRRERMQRAIAAITADTLVEALVQLAVAEIETDLAMTIHQDEKDIEKARIRIQFLIDSACRVIESEVGVTRQELGFDGMPAPGLGTCASDLVQLAKSGAL